MPRKHYTYAHPRPAVTVDIAVLTVRDRRLRVLLIRRRDEPFRGRWALPGGFVDIDEELADAARRELREETGVRGQGLRPFGVFGTPGRDPRGRTLSIGYFTLVAAERVRPAAGDDAAEVGWFSARRPPPLAFDHRQMLRAAVRAAGSRCLEDPRGLRRLLPPAFSMRALRETCEIVRGQRLEPRAFARRMHATGRLVAAGRGVYRF